LVSGAADFCGSEQFMEAVNASPLIGIERSYPVEVVKMGSRGKLGVYETPRLFGFDVRHSYCRVNYEAAGVRWWRPPDPDYCCFCGPGGGGKGGSFNALLSLVIEPDTWHGEDIFFPINLSGTMVL